MFALYKDLSLGHPVCSFRKQAAEGKRLGEIWAIYLKRHPRTARTSLPREIRGKMTGRSQSESWAKEESEWTENKPQQLIEKYY